MINEPNTYLALGDSMSIDLYTGVEGGGAVSQFYDWLKHRGQPWRLVDKTADMCRMRHVPFWEKGDLITLTIGGNDLLAEHETYLKNGLGSFAEEHLDLLSKIKENNPSAFLIVGNIYSSQTPLSTQLTSALDEANAIIAANVKKVGAHLADIRQAFRGHESDYLCFDIEPSLEGAAIITKLFEEAVLKAGGIRSS
jgi:lysophospholipase L1-like esterase